MAEKDIMGRVSVSNPKPLVQVACICEKVLIEPDNVPSLIRVVDTYTLELPGSEPPAGFRFGVNLTVFVSLKSGDVVGEFEVGLRLTAPDSTEHPVRTWPVEFRGDEHGANLTIAFSLQEPKFGLYWFDVLWGDDVLTKIPLRLKPRSTESTVAEAVPNETATHR
jgi:hypothetical protein